MKANIHPNYYHNTKVTCACGNTFETGSTLPEIKVDICSACHPFFTGEMKFVDTQGRVEKFQSRAQAALGDYKSKKQRRLEKNKQAEDKTPLTLREMIQAQRKEIQTTKEKTDQK